jgi:hypothetical protein
MSVTVSAWAWSVDLPPLEKYVLQALADHARKDGTSIYPSRDYLMWKTGLRERQLRRIISSLCQRGILIRVGGGYRGRVTEFRISPEKAVMLSPFERKAVTDDGKGGQFRPKGGQQASKRRTPESPRTIINHQEPSRTAAEKTKDKTQSQEQRLRESPGKSPACPYRYVWCNGRSPACERCARASRVVSA